MKVSSPCAGFIGPLGQKGMPGISGRPGVPGFRGEVGQMGHPGLQGMEGGSDTAGQFRIMVINPIKGFKVYVGGVRKRTSCQQVFLIMFVKESLLRYKNWTKQG